VRLHGGLALIALVAAGCGHEPVANNAGEDGPRTDSYRVERVMRFDGRELRSSGLVDAARGRSEWADGTTGCRSRTIDDVTYQELPPGLVPGKRWLRSTSAATDGERAFEETLTPEVSADGTSVTQSIFLFASPEPGPADHLDHLRRVGGELAVVGRENLGGVSTTHYRVVVDRAEEMRLELAAAGWKAVNVERYVEQLQPRTEQVDVWVDADGVARRVVETSTAPEPLPETTVTTTYYDFGATVDVAAPDPSEVASQEEWNAAVEARVPGSSHPGAASTCLD
jgi:hypothetical protein